MITVTKRLEFDAAHRVLRHESQCANLHGHRYAVEVVCTAPALDEVGRIIDFGVIKEKVGWFINTYLDHTTLVNSDDAALLDFCNKEFYAGEGRKNAYVFNGEPTAENIAKELYSVSQSLLAPYGVTVVEIVVYETPTSCARFRGEVAQ